MHIAQERVTRESPRLNFIDSDMIKYAVNPYFQGGDDVFMCVRMGSVVEVRHYFIDFRGSTPVLKSDNPLYNHQVHIGHHGRISCRFDRPLKVANDQYSVDLSNDWYQLYAWGPVSQSELTELLTNQ